jgi:hypothetical protein
MSFIDAAFLYPLLLAVLSLGAGLVVETLAGFRLPAALVPVSGFAALLVVSQFPVLSSATATWTPWVLVALAIVGFILGRSSIRTRWSNRGRWWWVAPGAAAATYLTVALPLIAAGRLTFPGYLLDTTAGFHLAVGDWILHHGVSLPPAHHAYGSALHDYFGNGYPAGGQTLLAVTGVLSGQSTLWLYFPFQVFALSVSSLVLTDLAQRAGLPRLAAGFTGWIAAVPALVTAYAQMGSIKEIIALPTLLLMGAVVVNAREHAAAGLRGAVPFTVAGAGALAAIGPAAVAWIGVFGLAALLVASPVVLGGRGRVHGLDSPAPVRLLAAAGVLVALLVIFSIPAITRLGSTLRTATGLSGSNRGLASDPGNLLRPLRWVQAFGVWLGGSHRIDPTYVNETYALIGVTILAFLLGVVWLFRHRRWSLLAFLAGSLIVWLALTKRGTEWTDAKVLMLTSPVVVVIALIGALGDLRRNQLQGAVLAVLIAGGVLASDAFLYHGTNLAPTTRYIELLSVGHRFAGQGPTLIPDFDEYDFYALRWENIDGPGFAGDMRGSFGLFGGRPHYGNSYDLDDIEAPDVQRFRLIVIRRSPRWSRPPANYRLVWSGSYYDVWRRIGPAPLLHIPAGGGLQPIGRVPCRLVHQIAMQAIKDGQTLRYGSKDPSVVADLSTVTASPSVIATVDPEGLSALTFTAPGLISTKLFVRQTGTYGVWLGGDLDRPLRVSVDGRQVDAPGAQSGGDGNMIRAGSAELTAGQHTIELFRGGGGLAPGNKSGNLIDGIFLQRSGSERETVVTVPAHDWRSLCGQQLDWLEVA